jgi:hypothetical protein
LHSVLEVQHRTALKVADVRATGFDQMIKNVRNCQTTRLFRHEKGKFRRPIARDNSFLLIPAAVCARALSGRKMFKGRDA